MSSFTRIKTLAQPCSSKWGWHAGPRGWHTGHKGWQTGPSLGHTLPQTLSS